MWGTSHATELLLTTCSDITGVSDSISDLEDEEICVIVKVNKQSHAIREET